MMTRLAALLIAAFALHAGTALAADGDLVKTPDGAVYRIVGGAPLWISTCSYTNGCSGVKAVDNLSAYKQFPADNAVVRNVTDGGYYRFAGGAPLLVRCDIGPNCTSPTTVDAKTFSNLGRPNATVAVHLRQYPANGAVIKNADDASIYRFAGNAPMPIAACACSPILVDARTFANAGTGTSTLPHIAAAPVDGTYLVAGTTHYRVAGGAAVQLVNCAPLANCPGSVAVDPATITGLAGGRLLATPRTGTVLRGLPSNQLWEIDGGYRHQTFANAAHIDVDDGAIALIPTPPVPAPPPAPTPPPPPPPFEPTVKYSYRVHGRTTQFTALSVRGLPAGATVTISCHTHGCPYHSHRYAPKHGKLATPRSIRRAHLRSATVTLTLRATTGARKVVTLRTRKSRAPRRESRCADPGGKLKAC